MIHSKPSIFYHESMTKNEFTLENYDGYKVINVQGRVDAFNDRAFTEFVSQAMTESSCLLAIHLKDCPFLNLASIRFLLGLHDRLSKEQGELAFVAPIASVQKHLDVFGGRIGLRIYRQLDDLGKKPVQAIRSEFIPDEAEFISIRSGDLRSPAQES